MPAKQVPLSTSQNVGIEIDSFSIRQIALKTDGPGDWMIIVSFGLKVPEPTAVEGLNTNLIANGNARITVTLQEIADSAELGTDVVLSTLTAAQLETAVTSIALQKVLTAYNLTM